MVDISTSPMNGMEQLICLETIEFQHGFIQLIMALGLNVIDIYKCQSNDCLWKPGAFLGVYVLRRPSRTFQIHRCNTTATSWETHPWAPFWCPKP